MAVTKYVRKRDGATVYCAVYFKPDGSRATEKVKTVKAEGSARDHQRAENKARSHADEQRIKVENGEWRPAGDATKRLRLRGLLKKFERGYETRSGQPAGQLPHYQYRLKVLREALGDRFVDQIADREIKRFREARLRKASESTVKKDLTVLSTVFRWAMAKGLASANPADALLVRRPAEPRRQVTPLSIEDEQKICDHAEDWLQRVIRFLVNTGLDRSDLVLLTWDQIDQEKQVLETARLKTGVPRRFLFEYNEPIKAVLAECKEQRKLGTGNRVFLGYYGEALTVEGLKTGFRRLYARIAKHEKETKVPEEKRLEVAGGPCRIFRHAFRSRLIDREVDRDLQRYLMGHGDRTMTDHYGAPSDRRLREAMRCPLYWSEVQRAVHMKTWRRESAQQEGS